MVLLYALLAVFGAVITACMLSGQGLIVVALVSPMGGSLLAFIFAAFVALRCETTRLTVFEEHGQVRNAPRHI